MQARYEGMDWAGVGFPFRCRSPISLQTHITSTYSIILPHRVRECEPTGRQTTAIGVALKSFCSKYTNEESPFDGVRMVDATHGSEDSEKDRIEIIDCSLM